jgi:hypothetical protein
MRAVQLDRRRFNLSSIEFLERNNVEFRMNLLEYHRQPFPKVSPQTFVRARWQLRSIVERLSVMKRHNRSATRHCRGKLLTQKEELVDRKIIG